MKPNRSLRHLLVEDATEQELQSIWRRVERNRVPEARRARFRPFIVYSASVAALAFATWFFASHRSEDGALRDIAGEPLNGLGENSKLNLSDGSQIELAADSELQVLSNDATTFSCALRRGRGTFEVKPGGPRRWRVEAGLVHVEVVGTRFIVERLALGTRVRVARGTVLVRGEHVPDGVQKLTVGNELFVPNAVDPAPMNASPTSVSPQVVATASAKASTAPPLGVAPTRGSLALADAQRRQGNIAGAIRTLTGIVDQSESDPERAIAAFTLGKLQLDAAGRPVQAAIAFRNCLRLSPPAAVAEDALARLVQAQVRSGDLAGARATAKDYERRYPIGRRLADVRQWLSGR